jgi:hypothetical protein
MWAVPYNYLFLTVDLLVGTCTAAIFLLSTGNRPLSPRHIILMGACAGLALALKQTALLVTAAPLLWLLLDSTQALRCRMRNAGLYLAIALLVFIVPFLIPILHGVLPEAVYWITNPGNFVNGAKEWTKLFDGNAWRQISLTIVFLPAYLIFWLQGSSRRHSGTLLWLLLISAAPINYPAIGYYHMMALLPSIALMTDNVAVLSLQSLSQVDPKTLARQAYIALGVGVLLATAVTALSPLATVFAGPSRRIYGWDELMPVSQWIQQNTRDTDRILVLPTFDTNGNIYAQANRLPPVYLKIWPPFASVPSNAAFLDKGVRAQPPEVVVIFPDLYRDVLPYLMSVDEFVRENYEEVARIENIPLQGTAVFYRRKASSLDQRFGNHAVFATATMRESAVCALPCPERQ